MHLFTVATSCSFVTSGNSFLKICTDIILSSLPVSVLYGIFMLFLSTNVLKLAVRMNQFISLTEQCIHSPFQCLYWPCLVCSLAPPHLLPWSSYSYRFSRSDQSCCTLCMPCQLPQYLHTCHAGVLDCADLFQLSLCIDLDTFILSKSLHSVILFITVAWAHCAYCNVVIAS